MNILFVEPVIVPKVDTILGRLVRKIYISNSLTFPQLAAVTPAKHKIKLLDERTEFINFNEECDVIGITCTTYYAPHAYEIADEFRKRGKTVVIGGRHPSALPEEAKQHADSVVIGEAELIWPALLEDLEKNRLKPFYKQKEPIDPNLIPFPRRELFKRQLPVARIQATRGCPYSCKFCSVSNIEGTHLRKRPIENVVEEMKSIPQKFLIFADASLTIDTEYTKNLFRNMKKLKKKFSCCGNAEVLNSDEELLKLSKEAGCVAWYIGFESFCQKSLDNMGKTTNRVEDYKTAVKKIHAYKMAVVGSFIVGFDEETIEDVRTLCKLIYDLEIETVEFGILTPFPGTPLFNQLEKEQRILTKDWSKYFEGDVVFKPKNMLEEELLKESLKTFKELYSFKNKTRDMLRIMKLGFYPFMWATLQGALWV